MQGLISSYCSLHPLAVTVPDSTGLMPRTQQLMIEGLPCRCVSLLARMCLLLKKYGITALVQFLRAESVLYGILYTNIWQACKSSIYT